MIRWPWRGRVGKHRNGSAAKQAVQQAQDSLANATRQTGHADQVAERGRAMADRASWFTQDMERALHLRRGSA